MTSLPVLLELQQVHDNLRTIQRDLTAFPSDLADLESERKRLAKRLDQLEKEWTEGLSHKTTLETAFAAATAAIAPAKSLAKPSYAPIRPSITPAAEAAISVR